MKIRFQNFGFRPPIWRRMWVLTAMTVLASSPLWAGEKPAQIQLDTLEIPNVAVRDQNGRELAFYDDLVKGKLVAMNFIFTSCPTICPPMGANFAALQKVMAKTGQPRPNLVSVSIDPFTDTPERLKAWRAKFGGGEGWHLVTGKKPDITKLLKILKVFSPDISAHAPFVIVGSDRTGWKYLNGLTEPEKLAEILAGLATARTQKKATFHGIEPPKVYASGGYQASGVRHRVAAGSILAGMEPPVYASVRSVEETPPAARYFTDIELTDQHGKTHKLYSDLIKGKTIVVNSFFASCTGVCPVTMGTMAKIQEWLGPKLGKDVYLLSLTVDPTNDNPKRLKAYGESLKARPGWFLLTGDKQKLKQALHKFGQNVAARENHSNIFIIGNDRTGLWKKARGLSPADQVIEVVRSVVEDHG